LRIEVKVPFLSEEIEYCRVLRWLVQPGEAVEIDQDLAELAAGDEVMAFPSPVDGRVVELCARIGAIVVTDETIAVIEDDYTGGSGH